MSGSRRIGADEAAARLGVKKETLYAYVSRGLLHPVKEDGRHSSFDPDELEALRNQRRRRRVGEFEMPIATGITRVHQQQLTYRGIPIETLVGDGRSLEAVAELLWQGQLPAGSPRWQPDRRMLATARKVQTELPADTPVIDRLRATVTVASASDPFRDDLSPEPVVAAGRRVIASLVHALPGPDADADTALSDVLWSRLTDRRGRTAERAVLRTALVVLADHELAASTLAARVTASVRGDVYSVLQAGLGPLAGRLHGGAGANVHRMLAEAEATSPGAAVAEALRAHQRIPGFGHLLYPDRDPRAALILDRVRAAAHDRRRLALADEVLDLCLDRSGRPPNIDFALATMAFVSHLPRPTSQTVFAVARCAGWIAHALEEYDERPLRFRPVARWRPRHDESV
ncbi:MAG: helix-turn-helix domain-containing protein [Acidimicrobiales bacterium]|nr:helix-turn-helix domain-containing protein [Acidimicrobiales bacterium]